MPGMVRVVRGWPTAIPDSVRTRGISLSDCLMSDLAVFRMKMPSLPGSTGGSGAAGIRSGPGTSARRSTWSGCPTTPALPFDQGRRFRRPLFHRARERQARNLHLRDRMRRLVGTFVFPDRETPLPVALGAAGKEDLPGLIRAGP